jgi:hypothetical protein
MRIGTLLYQRVRYLTPVILAILFFLPLKMFSQSGDIDQIRNGPATDPSKNFWDDFDNPQHVNGNAGASNAHYVESHSISYRSLLTGCTVNRAYQYVIEYDTKHSDRMAIDYLTHFQRLLPHDQFGHDPEVINPLIVESGNKEYIMGTVGQPDTFGFPVPSSVGSPVANLPTNSFLALPKEERVLTAYNGDITNIQYVFQQSLTNGKTESMTRVIITFTAKKDSVMLAWGGHIANRNEWGFIEPGHIPRSAGGISGSPYHMRQISMNILNGANISGVGNQDRSLSANAVIAPPSCSISNALFKCPEEPSLTFNYTGGTSGATFVWTIEANNSAGAKISAAGNTNSSVVIVPVGSKFTPGTFNLTLAVTANGLTQTCSLTPAGTIVGVSVVASAFSSSFSLTVKDTTHLNAVASPPPNTDYDFSWSQDPTSGGSLSANNIANPLFTATEAGTYTFIVTATQKAAPNCVAKDTITVEVTSSRPECGISGPDPVCPGSTNTYKFDIDGDGTAENIPDNFTALWTLEDANGATLGADVTSNTVQVTAGADCKKSFKLIITLTSTSGLITKSCDTTITVDVSSPLDISCPPDKDVTCSESKLPANTGEATADDNGCGVKIYYKDVITRTWIAEDACGNRDTCTQVITVTDSCVTQPFQSNARMITNSGPVPATQGSASPVLSPVKSKITSPAISPKTTSIKMTKELQVQAFPNPFSNTINFRFTSPLSGRAILEVFNTQGQRVGIAFDGKVDAGIAKNVQFSTRLTNQALIYRLKVGDKTIRGTVLELKR